jgi:hypothetical protein
MAHYRHTSTLTLVRGRMKNTYNIGLLRRRILEALPRQPSQMGEAAVEGFLSLPGASAWRPDRLWLKELSYVFDIGLPFALIGDNPSAKMHGLRVGEVVRFGQYPPKDLWSQVHAAALLSKWGAHVQFAPDAKTHALEVQLGSGETVNVEVFRSHPPLDVKDHAGRSHLIAVDVHDASSQQDEIGAILRAGFQSAPQLSGVLLFEPRFWIGIEQKEWVHFAHRNPNAKVPIASEALGIADGNRHALRIPLLI